MGAPGCSDKYLRIFSRDEKRKKDRAEKTRRERKRKRQEIHEAMLAQIPGRRTNKAGHIDDSDPPKRDGKGAVVEAGGYTGRNIREIIEVVNRGTRGAPEAGDLRRSDRLLDNVVGEEQ